MKISILTSLDKKTLDDYAGYLSRVSNVKASRYEKLLQQSIKASLSARPVGRGFLPLPYFAVDEDKFANTSLLRSMAPSTQTNIRSSRLDVNQQQEREVSLRDVLSRKRKGKVLFDFLQNTEIHKQAFSASNPVNIYTKLQSSGSVFAYAITIPSAAFTSTNFGAEYRDGEVRYYIKNEYEKKIMSSANRAIRQVNSMLMEDARDISKTSRARIKNRQETVNILWRQTNSIPTATGKIFSRRKKYRVGQFMSVIALTELVKQRVRLRMRRGSGPPRPPKIYERTGTFRNSIQVVANYRTNKINYYYIPYYFALEKYGYEIDDLVEGSIHAVTLKQFKRRFNLEKSTTPLF